MCTQLEFFLLPTFLFELEITFLIFDVVYVLILMVTERTGAVLGVRKRCRRAWKLADGQYRFIL